MCVRARTGSLTSACEGPVLNAGTAPENKKKKKTVCASYGIRDQEKIDPKGLVVFNPSCLSHLKNSYKAKQNQQHVAPVLAF